MICLYDYTIIDLITEAIAAMNFAVFEGIDAECLLSNAYKALGHFLYIFTDM